MREDWHREPRTSEQNRQTNGKTDRNGIIIDIAHGCRSVEDVEDDEQVVALRELFRAG